MNSENLRRANVRALRGGSRCSAAAWLVVIATAIEVLGCDSSNAAAGPMLSTGSGAVSRVAVPPGYLPAQPAVLSATVDGDTARFLVADGERTVRFLYVNTEETHGARTTPFGLESASRVAEALRRARAIALAFRPNAMTGAAIETDVYGRALGLVYVDGQLLQTWIVREGMSPYYTSYGCAPADVHAELLQAEGDARTRGVGIWQAGHPIDYRAQIERWVSNNPCRPAL